MSLCLYYIILSIYLCKTKRIQLLSINFLLCICCSLKCSGHHDKSCIMKQNYPTPRNRQCHWSFQNILNILRHKVIRVYQYNYNFKYYDDVAQIESYQAAFFSRTCICIMVYFEPNWAHIMYPIKYPIDQGLGFITKLSTCFSTQTSTCF